MNEVWEQLSPSLYTYQYNARKVLGAWYDRLHDRLGHSYFMFRGIQVEAN